MLSWSLLGCLTKYWQQAVDQRCQRSWMCAVFFLKSLFKKQIVLCNWTSVTWIYTKSRESRWVIGNRKKALKWTFANLTEDLPKDSILPIHVQLIWEFVQYYGWSLVAGLRDTLMFVKQSKNSLNGGAGAGKDRTAIKLSTTDLEMH